MYIKDLKIRLSNTLATSYMRLLTLKLIKMKHKFTLPVASDLFQGLNNDKELPRPLTGWRTSVISGSPISQLRLGANQPPGGAAGGGE